MKKVRIVLPADIAVKIAQVLVPEKRSFTCLALPEGEFAFTFDGDSLLLLQERGLVAYPGGPLQAEWLTADEAIEVNYTNWKGKTRRRKIIPLGLRFGESPYHPGRQWLLEAIDPEDGQVKDFSLNTCVFDLSRLPH